MVKRHAFGSAGPLPPSPSARSNSDPVRRRCRRRAGWPCWRCSGRRAAAAAQDRLYSTSETPSGFR